MARLVEDSSDNDLPELAILLKSKAHSTTTTKKPQARRVRSPEKKGSATAQREEAMQEQTSSRAVSKSAARRRLLNPKTENPLLLPFMAHPQDGEVKKPRTKIVALEKSSGSRRIEISPKKERTRKPEYGTPDLSSDDDVFGYGTTARRVEKGPKKASGTRRELPKECARPERNTAMAQEALPTGSKDTFTGHKISEKEEADADGSSGMSDFVVDDGVSLSEYSEEAEDSDLPLPPPKSAGKLVRGRKPERRASIDEDITDRLKMMGLEDENEDLCNLGARISGIDIQKNGKRGNGIDRRRLASADESESRREATLPSKKESSYTDTQASRYLPSSSYEQPSAILQFSPPRSKSPIKIKIPDQSRLKTPPPSSPKKLSRSPKKLFPSIPPTPHRQSAAEFWDPVVTNEWVDQHSPKKASPFKPLAQPISKSPSKNNPCPRELKAKRFKTEFEKVKAEFALAFLKDLDQTITSGQLSAIFASTGGIEINWSKTLKKTAGQAFYKHSVDSKGVHKYTGRIELATKVVDDEHRLLNTIAHEFCHLANFGITKELKKPHGEEFMRWGRKVEAQSKGLVRRHFERDVGGFRGRWKFDDVVLRISTCHQYEIDFKYQWECITPNCKTLFQRHSKSIKPEIQRCGKCKGLLVQIKPVPRNNNNTSSKCNSTTTTTCSHDNSLQAGGSEGGVLNGYQQFVRDNMARIRAENAGRPQTEMMGLLSRAYREMKAGRERGGGCGGGGDGGGGGGGDGGLEVGKEEVGGGVNSDDDGEAFLDAIEKLDLGDGGKRKGKGKKIEEIVDLISDDE